MAGSRVRVSVLIPSYEAGALLLDSIASVASQEGFAPGVDLEVVIADDGSNRPDSAAAMAKARAVPWVTVVQTGGRIGPSGARNLAARHARGEWLSFLDADDLYAPDALRVRLQAVALHEGVTCAATDYAEFPADAPFHPAGLPGVIATTPGRRVPVQRAHDTGMPLLLDKPLDAFIGAVPFWTGSVLIRRDRFERLGGFPEGHFIGEDIHLWLRIAASERIVYVPRITAFCRKGHASLTAGETAMNLKTARCYEDLATDPSMRPVMARLRRLIADSYLGESYVARGRRDGAAAFRMAMHSLRWQPASAAAWRALLLAPLPPRGTR
jgi:GT2 family glycosyltransferase